MAKVLGVDVGAVRDKMGGHRVGDLSGGLGSAVGAVGDLGAFLREQREQAQMSLRQLAAAAGVSNPYLSQVERGLRRPSAEVLQQIARGLRISAEALYVRAGILEERPGADGDVREALLSDPFLSERQRQVVLEIYSTFRAENARSEVPTAPGGPRPADGGDEPAAPARTASRRRRRTAPAPGPAVGGSDDEGPGEQGAGEQGSGEQGSGEQGSGEQGSGEGSGPRSTAPASRRAPARSRRRSPGGRPSPRDVAEEAGLTVPSEPSPQESAATHPADGTPEGADAARPTT
ncbi:helix-turn-helix transcriptional regulator [Pseudokineococcus basanitobsidens]|uniref:Helix-turn-helix transcriptional regulator n=1 Tax=Pseudokineococcus basanitobsidens TaxID=1926649 RepID=A0ABU8RNZ2_9ACTN